MNNKQTTLLALLGLIKYSEAIKLPDYWDGVYSNTWFYAGRPYIVNAEEWKEEDPAGYKDAVWNLQLEDDESADFGEITQVQVGDIVLNLGQKANGKRYDHLEEQKSTVIDTAKQAWTDPQFEKADEVAWHTQTIKNVGGTGAKPAYQNGVPVYGGDGKATYTFSNQGSRGFAGLAQKQARDLTKYNHLDEQKSTIEPYVVRDHSWNEPEFTKSDEVEWHKQTVATVGGNGASAPAYAHDDPVYGGDGKGTYTWNNQGMAGYSGLAQKDAQAKYSHLWEQKSYITPWVQRDNAFNEDEFTKEDEVEWHKQTIKNVGGTAAAPAYGNGAPVYSGDGEATYTWNNQDMNGYTGHTGR